MSRTDALTPIVIAALMYVAGFGLLVEVGINGALATTTYTVGVLLAAGASLVLATALSALVIVTVDN